MKLELKKISVWAAVKVSFMLNLILGFIVGLFMPFFFCLDSQSADEHWEMKNRPVCSRRLQASPPSFCRLSSLSSVRFSTRRWLPYGVRVQPGSEANRWVGV